MLIIFVHYHDHLGVAWQDTLKPSSSARAPWASSWRSAWPAPARVLEAESAIGESPRAAIYFPTTVRILDRLGLLEEARAIGLESNEFCYHVPEHGTRIHVNTRAGLPPDEPYPYNLHFGQHILAQLVMRHLERLPNATVLFKHRVVGLAQRRGPAARSRTPCGHSSRTRPLRDRGGLALSPARALRAALPGGARVATERRRVFREVTSPIASEFKRRLAEVDPTRRVEDEAVMRRMAEDPANAPPATLLAEQLFGNPMPV